MAAYREHITVSGALGVGVGLAASWLFGFTGVQGALAGCLTGVGGMLPDLDSKSGRPVREIFGAVAAIAPLVLMRRLIIWGGDLDGAMLLAVLVYVSIRYGAAQLLGMVAVHRGMFHSIPAMLIAGELVFMAYHSSLFSVKLLMGLGVIIGFGSHLILDEIYAVQWNGIRVKLNKAAGSAFKLMGNNAIPNIVTYGLLFMLTYALFIDPNSQQQPPTADRGILRPAQNAEQIERIDLRRR